MGDFNPPEMSKLSKIILALVVLLWLLIGSLYAYNKIYLAGERRGYDRGLKQGLIYRRCSIAEPSEGFKSEMWNLVNMPNDCRFVEAVERRAAAKD